jgi:hypothetical protein
VPQNDELNIENRASARKQGQASPGDAFGDVSSNAFTVALTFTAKFGPRQPDPQTGLAGLPLPGLWPHPASANPKSKVANSKLRAPVLDTLTTFAIIRP